MADVLSQRLERLQAENTELRAALSRLQADNERLKAELDDMEAERDEALRGPWPEWAEQIRKRVRAGSGYDGYDDDADGVDLPGEVSEHLDEVEAMAERERTERINAQGEAKALAAMVDRLQAGGGEVAGRSGACDECGKKAADGWALMCVACAEAFIGQKTNAPEGASDPAHAGESKANAGLSLAMGNSTCAPDFALDHASGIQICRRCGRSEVAHKTTHPAAPAKVLAWAHPDGRVVSAETKEQAERDGGAMRSSLAGYTIPCGPLWPAKVLVSLSESRIRELASRSEVYQYHPGAIDEFVRAVEKAHGIE